MSEQVSGAIFFSTFLHSGGGSSLSNSCFPLFLLYQMPISQPPAGKTDTLTDKPGSVGVPVAASTAIVSRGTLRLQPHGVEGEIAISGTTVLKRYLDNPAADMKSFFLLTQKGEAQTRRYFLTGDVGVLDSEGFLFLKGRAKELIKKGGEQGMFLYCNQFAAHYCTTTKHILWTRGSVRSIMFVLPDCVSSLTFSFF